MFGNRFRITEFARVEADSACINEGSVDGREVTWDSTNSWYVIINERWAIRGWERNRRFGLAADGFYPFRSKSSFRPAKEKRLEFIRGFVKRKREEKLVSNHSWAGLVGGGPIFRFQNGKITKSWFWSSALPSSTVRRNKLNSSNSIDVDSYFLIVLNRTVWIRSILLIFWKWKPYKSQKNRKGWEWNKSLKLSSLLNLKGLYSYQNQRRLESKSLWLIFESIKNQEGMKMIPTWTVWLNCKNLEKLKRFWRNLSVKSDFHWLFEKFNHFWRKILWMSAWDDLFLLKQT